MTIRITLTVTRAEIEKALIEKYSAEFPGGNWVVKFLTGVTPDYVVAEMNMVMDK